MPALVVAMIVAAAAAAAVAAVVVVVPQSSDMNCMALGSFRVGCEMRCVHSFSGSVEPRGRSKARGRGDAILGPAARLLPLRLSLLLLGLGHQLLEDADEGLQLLQ